MKLHLEQLLELVKTRLELIKAYLVGLRKVTNKEPKLVTKKVNVGSATLVVQLVSGLTVTGFVKGTPEKDLDDLLSDITQKLNYESFIELDTQEAIAVVPSANIVLIKRYKTDQFVEVTYEVSS